MLVKLLTKLYSTTPVNDSYFLTPKVEQCGATFSVISNRVNIQSRHTSGVPQKVLVVSVWEMPSLHNPKSVKMICPFKKRTHRLF